MIPPSGQSGLNSDTPAPARAHSASGRPVLILALSIPGLLFFPLAIAAAVLGARYRRKVERGDAPESVAARAGFVLGAAGVFVGMVQVCAFVYLLPALFGPGAEEYEDAAMAALRDIQVAQANHFRLTGEYAPTVEVLLKRGFLDTDPRLPGGYRIEMCLPEGRREFEVRASPIMPGAPGMRHFYIDHSGVLRWSNEPGVGRHSPALNAVPA